MLTMLRAKWSGSPASKKTLLALVAAGMFLGGASAAADTVSFSGLITQSTQSGTGPAVNNPDLNKILLGDAFTVTVDFMGSINGPGTYPLAGASLLFHDVTALVDESSFDSVSISVLPDGSFFDISMFGCLTTGGGCLTGNSLSANFQILAAGLNSQNVPAFPIFGLSPPVDLLEDDGITDIQGSVSSYSYVSASAVPEPSGLAPLCLLLAAMAWMRQRKTNGGRRAR
jgi:hypothetical protein